MFFAIHPDSTKIYFIGHFGNFSFLFNFLLVLVLSKIGCLRLSYANREDIILCRRTGWLFSGQAIPEKSLFNEEKLPGFVLFALATAASRFPRLEPMSGP